MLALIASVIIILGTILLGGELWRMGGDGKKWARAVAFPALVSVAKLALCAINLTWSWWFLLCLVYWPVLYGLMSLVSYGVTAPPHVIWVWIIGKITGQYDDPAWKAMADNGQIASVEIATRCTCGFAWSLAGAVFAYVTGGWLWFAIYVPFLTIANGLIWLLIPDVEVNERAVGKCVATSVII